MNGGRRFGVNSKKQILLVYARLPFVGGLRLRSRLELPHTIHLHVWKLRKAKI